MLLFAAGVLVLAAVAAALVAAAVVFAERPVTNWRMLSAEGIFKVASP